MKEGKEKKHVKVKPGSADEAISGTKRESPTTEAEDAYKKAVKSESKKERHEMKKIEELCKQYGVPDPSELYIVPREFEVSGNPNITQFEVKMPEGLARWVGEEKFEYTIGQINAYFALAQGIHCRTVLNSICKFLTCFMIRACQKSSTERAIVQVRNFIAQQNKDIYHSKGFHIADPAALGLRHLEFRSITYSSVKYFLDHQEGHGTDSKVHIPHDQQSHPHHVQPRRSVIAQF